MRERTYFIYNHELGKFIGNNITNQYYQSVLNVYAKLVIYEKESCT